MGKFSSLKYWPRNCDLLGIIWEFNLESNTIVVFENIANFNRHKREAIHDKRATVTVNRLRICLGAKKSKVNCVDTAGRQTLQILTASQQSVRVKSDVFQRLRNVWCCLNNNLNLCHIGFPVMGVKLGHGHWGRKGSWGCLRTWCWGEYLDRGGTR
jgi:hypothetical protein